MFLSALAPRNGLEAISLYDCGKVRERTGCMRNSIPKGGMAAAGPGQLGGGVPGSGRSMPW